MFRMLTIPELINFNVRTTAISSVESLDTHILHCVYIESQYLSAFLSTNSNVCVFRVIKKF